MSIKRIVQLTLLAICFATATAGVAFQSFTVQRIRVEGLKRVSEAAVINELPIRIGQTLTEERAGEVVQALYASGFFKNVSLGQDGQTLVIKVEERATISKLTFTGVKEKEKVQKLLREVGLAEGRLYDPNVIGKAQRELEKYYFSKGRYNVRIEPTVTETSPGLMEVTLCIYEGDMAKIKQIKIIGNCVFKESDLLDEFRSAKTNILSWFTGNDQYAKEKLNADLEILRSYYLDRGYIHFQIESVQVSLTPDKKDIYITIHIKEGEQYVFGETTLSGRFVAPEKDLLCLIEPLEPGATFSRKVLLDVKQALEDRMGSEGYYQSEARLDHFINEQKRTVNIRFSLIPGRRIYVRRIQFVGNTTTKDEVLRRELPQLEGTWASSTLIEEGKEKILRRGFASNVEVETKTVVGAEDQMDVVYKVEETRLGQIGAGFGYSGSEKLMFNFSISQENFLGTGKAVDFTLDKSRASSNYAIGYLDPYFTPDGIGFGGSAYYSKSNLSKTSFVTDYIVDTLGGEIRWVFPINKDEALKASIGYDDTRLKIHNRNPATQLTGFINKFGNKFDEYVVSLGWVYDTFDKRIFPTSGVHQAINLQSVIPGAKQQYYKGIYEFSWYYPICESERWIVNVSSALGFGDGYGKTTRMPFYRNFFAGGSRFVRGYGENSLGPRDSNGGAMGGNALAAGTAALIFPNPIKPDAQSVRTALFLDVGQVYDTHKRKGPTDTIAPTKQAVAFRYSVGLSVAWHLPILGAPLTVSLAKPLNPKAGDEKRSFSFWVGTSW